MSTLLEKFQLAKVQFEKDREQDDGWKIMHHVVDIVNELGEHFATLNGGELSEMQMKLSGYKFYLADYLADLNRISEALKLEIKNIRAERWDEISETIKAEFGKVKNKDQIENVLILETKELQNKQILYETLFYKYKLKVAAINDILTSIVQRIAELKKQVDQSKHI